MRATLPANVRAAVPPLLGESAIIAEGRALYDAGRLAEALALVDAAIEKASDSGVLHFARAATLFAWGRFHEAYLGFERAYAAGLDDLDLDLHRGWMSVNLGRIDEAEGHFRRAVARDPGSVTAYTSLANALETRGALKDRAGEFVAGLARWPDSYDAQLLRALCCSHLGDPEAGIAAFRQAIALDPQLAKGWANLGVALMDAGRSEEALDALFRAHRIDVANGGGDSVVNLASVLRETGHIDEMLALLEENLAQNPDPRTHWLRSVLLLEQGHYREAWPQHEFRWMKEPLVAHRPKFAAPVWGGQDLRGRTILLHAEQGLGDAIQFIRFARSVKAMGARVLFDSFRDLGDIARDFRDVDEVLVDGTLPAVDFRISLLSLPRVLRTTAASIPAHVPYVDVLPAYREKWAARIGDEVQLKVGIVWSGNPKHPRDKLRSMSLAPLAALAHIPGIRLYSLQKGATAEVEIASCGFDVIDLARDFESFRDTAAAISVLDLVIAVDTSVAHLAGALGHPTWTLIAEPPDWRWQSRGHRTPWYPTMRIFRQAKRGEWDTVIDEVARALEGVVRSGAPLVPSREDERGVDAESAEPAPPAPGAGPPRMEAAQAASRFCGVDETRNGIVQSLPSTDLAASLSYYGEYRQAELNLIARFMRQGSWVFEQGCGIGAATLFLARTVGESGHIIAYESDRLRHQIAQQNLTANRFRNVTLLRRGLGGPDAVHGIANASAQGGLAADTIDGLRVAQLDWIVIHSGAMAAMVLAGGSETLWRLRPRVFVVTGNNAEEDAALAVLRDHAYQCRRFRAPLFHANNYNRRTDDIFGGRTAMGLFCVPEEVEIDTELEGCTPVESTR